MTVPVQTPVTSSVANGVTTVFPFTFKITNEADLTVTVDDIVVTTGFTVTGIGNDDGGDVTFDTAPANGLKVIRFLNPVLSRVVDYQQFGDWLAPIVNGDFDRIWLTLQYLSQALVRTLQLPVDTVTQQAITEDATERSGKLVGFDSNGDITLTVAADLELTTVTNFMATLLLAVDAAAARTLLESSSINSNKFNGIQRFANRISLSVLSTLNLTGGGSNTYTCTGSGTVSAVTLDNGTWAIVTYPAGVTLQYSATSHRLNTGAANYTTEANDAVFYFGLNGVVAGLLIKSSGQPIGLVNATNDPTFIKNDGFPISSDWLKGLFNLSGSAPAYACRAWVNFNGTGTVSIRGSGNVSSITDNGTGLYTVNFSVAMPHANYCPNISWTQIASTGGNYAGGLADDTSAYTENAMAMRFQTGSGIDTDLPTVAVSVFC